MIDTIEAGCDLSKGIPDFVFVDAGPADTSDYASFALHQGRRWYHRAVVPLLLHVQAAEGPITTDHFKACFRASRRVLPETARARYEDTQGAMKATAL